MRPSARPLASPLVRDGTDGPTRTSPVEAARVTVRRAVRLAERLGLGPLERTALGVWLMSRLGVLVISWVVAWTTQPSSDYTPRPWTSLWKYWDYLRYQDIAAHGYSLGGGQQGSSIAFFPGYPALLWLVHAVVRDWVWSGLLISFVTGAFVSVGLARVVAGELARRRPEPDSPGDAGRPVARDAVLFLVCAPAAIFLAAGYTEAPFLAFALFGWLAARDGRWFTSGLLLAAATAIRINGVFVLIAVLLIFVLTRPRGRDWWSVGWLLSSLAPLIGFMVYLHQLTGDWLAWQHAEASGWYRSFADPITSLRHTWYYAFQHGFTAGIAWEYQLEIVAAVVGLVALIALLVKRRWPEATYVGCSLASLVTSYYFMSLPRDMLLWWPVFIGLAVLSARHPWIRTGYLLLSTPIMFGLSYLYMTGQWAG